jgi:predicted transcriptional regulator
MEDYNFRMYTNITKAMNNHNKIMTGPRFNTLDAAILNLIKSFKDSNTSFFISNKELGEIMVADPSTVQRSVDRLANAGLIKKENIYVGNKPQRRLIYMPEATEQFLKSYMAVIK